MSVQNPEWTAEISVIIVNYGTVDLTIAAVESVLSRQHGGRRVDVHVVDNASPDDDASRLMDAARRPDWHGRVEVYAESENHGFGRGNNVVLRKLAARDVPPTYAFLLNPDAALKNEAIAELADFMDRKPSCAVSGARILNTGDIPAVSAFRFPGLISEFSGALSFGPVARLLRRWEVPLGTDLDTCRVDWVSGAATMFRFLPAHQAKFFDPDFFLYYEEVDLMRRIGLARWETWHVAEAEVMHLEGFATELRSGEAERKRRPAYWYESWRLFFTKAYGRPYALAIACAWGGGGILNHILAALCGRQIAVPLCFLTDLWGEVLRPLIGLRKRSG